MTTTLTETPTLAKRSTENQRYRDLIAAKVAGEEIDGDELDQLRAILEIEEYEHAAHVLTCGELAGLLKEWDVVTEAKKQLPVAIAELNKVLERHFEIIPRTRTEMKSREAERESAKAKVADLRNTIANGNTFYWRIDKLTDPTYIDEWQIAAKRLEELTEEAEKRRDEARPEIVYRDGKKETRGIKYYKSQAQFALDDAEKKKASDKIIKISYGMRRLKELTKQIRELSAEVRRLELRRPTAADFTMELMK